MKIFQVDAFASAVFGGNPAAVCPLDAWLPDQVLQSIAAENNLSETAFFVPTKNGLSSDYEIRWFTPNTEVDLCGHATLAAAFIQYTKFAYAKPSLCFSSKSGELRVTRSNNQYQLDFPALPYQALSLSSDQIQALGVVPKACYESRLDLLCIFDDEHVVAAAEPHLAEIATWKYRGVIFSAPVKDPAKGADIYSRCFYPRCEVPEDPVTGSAHCVIAPYWSQVLKKAELTALQGSKRRGRLTCVVRDDRVLLLGECHLYMEGVLSGF